MKSRPGFTLAEVLIALALLGVIAAFAIPKVLHSTADLDKGMRAKEAMASVYEVYHRAWLNDQLQNNTTSLSSVMTTGLNGTLDTISKVDVAVPVSPGTPIAVGDCAADVGRICYRLPSGALLTSNVDTVYKTGTSVGGHKYALWLTIDPDGKVNGTTSSVGDALSVVMVNDGRLYSAGKLPQTVTLYYGGAAGESNLAPGVYADPAWLTW